MIDLAIEKKCKSIHLEVNENNESAINLYKKFSFKQDGMRKNYYNKGTENAILMTLKL